MNIKLSEEKVKILKEEGIHFIDAIDEKTYYQYPKQVYKETDNEFIFELVDKVLEPIKLPSDEEIVKISFRMFNWNDEHMYCFQRGAKWMKEQILNQNK